MGLFEFSHRIGASRVGRNASLIRRATKPNYGFRLAETFFPEMIEWRAVLDRLSVPLRTRVDIAARARREGRSFQTGLTAYGVIEATELVESMGDELGLGVAADIDPAQLIVRAKDCLGLLRRPSAGVPVRLIEEREGRVAFLVPAQTVSPAALRDHIRRLPVLASRLKLTDAGKLRAALLKRARPALMKIATSGLSERFPKMSASVVLDGWQGYMIGTLATLLPVALLLAFGPTITFLHGLATFFFLACVVLRLAVVLVPRTKTEAEPPKAPSADEAPMFAVLVALYKEAEIIPNLIASLDRLVWPRDRLQIKLVCEADDRQTLAAIRANPLPPHFEIVEVPSGGPRTKPKALSYALPMSGGDFIVLYDAEDQPDPMQLVEAWRKFEAEGPDLAVVQAPLEISNRGESIIARMFAFEYAGLFRGLLPWLAGGRMVLPLGGTSNHFRRQALEEVGAWDPYNVTEDADIAMRFARFGYRADVIRRPTYEAAPTRFAVWLPQRTRWFKGWLQTWLVHMRDPMQLMRQLGPGSFMVAQILFAGMLASVLLHPLLFGTFLYLAVEIGMGHYPGPFKMALLAVDVVNIACGYLSFLLLGWRSLRKGERHDLWKVFLFTPVYWLMMSAAGWRAVWQLWRKPHHWEKTPHDNKGRVPEPNRPQVPTQAASPVAGAFRS